MKGTWKKNLYLSFSFIFFYWSVLFILKIKSFKILPNYYYDSNDILNIMQTKNYDYSKSFGFAAKFFNFFNFLNSYDWTTWTVMINVVILPLLIFFILKMFNLNIYFFLWLICSTLMVEIYILHVSKDIINFVVIFMYSFFIFKLRKSIPLFLALGISSIFMAIIFREYYILTFLIFIILFLLYKSNKWLKLSIFSVVCLLVLYALPLDIFTSVFGIRQQVNSVREVSDAQSMINDWIPFNGSKELMFFNFFVNIFRFLFPIDILLKSLNPAYLAFFLYIVFTTYVLLKNYSYAKKNKDEKILHLSLWSFSIIITHSIFEPDFGSYTRHFISYFAIWYINVWFYFSNRKINRD
ncbi:hypothetical protein ACDN41_02465 [Priestia aryabhattai]|uniref:hypothetical protein n=1 Tax=Priestia aryabhattai TaxID=412384 RepID=UPI003531C496